MFGFDEGYVFDQEADHAFSGALWCFGVLPQAGEVGGEDAGALLRCELRFVFLGFLFVIFLGGGECAQFGVPVGFELVGFEPVVGIDAHEAGAREVGFVACALDLVGAVRRLRRCGSGVRTERRVRRRVRRG